MSQLENPSTSLTPESDNGSSELDPAKEAWGILFSVMRSFRQRAQGIMARHELSFQQGMMLHLMGESGPRAMNEFAGVLACDASNVTGLVDRLETRGLIARQASEHDRRVKMIVLTEAGHVLQRKLEEDILQPPSVFARLSLEDQRSLRDILRRVMAMVIEENEAEPGAAKTAPEGP